MPFTIKDEDNSDLCTRCVHVQIVQDGRGTRKFCGELHTSRNEIYGPVTKCSIRMLRGEMDEYEAKQLGWVLEVKKGEVIGFVPPKKRGELE